MRKRSVLITDDVHDAIIEGFVDANFEVDYQPSMTLSEVRSVIADFDGLIINSKVGVDKELLDEAGRLKFIGRLGSGLDHVDMKACENAGVAVFRSPEGNANAVGEHCLAMLLALLNKLHITNAQLKENIWQREENRGRELDGLTVGIIGYGHTGPAFAKKLGGFDVKTMIFDKYVPVLQTEGGSSVDAICQHADVISFHIPLNSETAHMIDASFIDRCKKTPILINSSRGGILSTPAVLDALKEGRISGLCIDVFEDEPISKGKINDYSIYKELLGMEQVISSPHIAGWSHRSKYLLSKLLLDKILKFIA